MHLPERSYVGPVRANDWTISITDVTNRFHEVHALVESGHHDGARGLLPNEALYPFSPDLVPAIGATA